MSESPPPPRTLAEKIDHLFRTIHPPGRDQFSYREVAAGINKRMGQTAISSTYLWQLRTGQSTDPKKSHLEAIADFFGVPPTYFFDDDVARRVEAELDLLRVLRDSPVRQLAFRAVDLSPEGLAAVADMIEHLRRIEGLPDGPERSRRRRPSRPNHPTSKP